MEIEYGFIEISQDDVAEAITAEAKEAAIVIMREDLSDYINKMGVEATFKGWIAHICPENVKIDKRLERRNSEWHFLWNTAAKNYNKQENSDILPVVHNAKKRKYNSI